MSDTEKITINLGAVDLGRVDLLVREGHYSNRTDFIRTAIRGQLEKHGIEVQQSVARNAYVFGILQYGRKSLERLKERGERMNVNVIGSCTIEQDVPPELAAAVIERVRVRGIFSATDAVKEALADRMA